MANYTGSNRQLIFEPMQPQPEHLGQWPLFSVITPSFNQAHYIGQTIQSVLAQNYPNFEHFVLDGASTDHTVAVLKKFSHLKWTSEPDSGQSEAVNKGLLQAKGEIIAWINSDDWYEPGIFHAIATFFLNNPEKDIVMGTCKLVDDTGRLIRHEINQERGFDELKKYWVGSSIPTQPAIFFRRRLIKECGLLDSTLHYGMDYDLWLRFARNHRFYHIDRLAAYYRFHSAAKGGDQDWKKFIPEWSQIYRRYVPSPLISIIVPAFNAEGVLKDALSSIQSQSYRNFEVIVVDDGSTDQTAHVARGFEREDSRFKLIQQPNDGVSGARNAALRLARGEWIAFLDADDVWLPEKLERQMRLVEETGTQFVFSNYILWNGKSDLGLRYSSRKKFPGSGVMPRLVFFNLLGISTVLLHRGLVERTGEFDPQVAPAEDWDYWLRICEKGVCPQGIWEPLARYRFWEGNASKQSARMAGSAVQVLEKGLARSSGGGFKKDYQKSSAIARGHFEFAKVRPLLDTAPQATQGAAMRAWQCYPWRVKWLLWSWAAACPKCFGGELFSRWIHRQIRRKW